MGVEMNQSLFNYINDHLDQEGNLPQDFHLPEVEEENKKKREELMMYANGVQIKIPTIEKDDLIQRACNHYNRWDDWRLYKYDDIVRATPSSDESFLKRITINYLRQKCTCYEKELEKFQKKVGVQVAHDILQKRINDAIIQKYEWLR